MDPNRVLIFDTTLRDGEQSPGISLNTGEKLEIAQQLARLGVDVIEAGFPITSPGDFEAVQAIARDGARARSSPAWPARHRRTSTRPASAVKDADAPAHPHLHLDLGHPHRAPAPDHARGRQGAGPRGRGARRAATPTTSSSRPWTRPAPTLEFTAEVCADRDRRGRDHDQHPRHRRLHDAPRVRGLPGAALRARARACATSCSRCTATTTWAWRSPTPSPGVLAGARQVECAINGIGERAGNASLEEIVMLLRTREADVGPAHRGQHRASWPAPAAWCRG